MNGESKEFHWEKWPLTVNLRSNLIKENEGIIMISFAWPYQSPIHHNNMQLISVSHGVGYMTFTCLLIMTEYRNCIYSNNLSNPVHYVLTILYNLVKVILDPKSCLRNRVIFMQDHIPYKPFRICLPNSKLLSGIYGMWSFMQITQHNFLL